MFENTTDSTIKTTIRNRRTFAIISHPDAGKTTLTEKLLLYSGMLRTAGMVRGRKNSKATSSDWMALEQERGISITASAMQFPYKDTLINVLDTPGHQDFSEDTYRTLTAADSAVMVIDGAKGVETQTKKLFAVCALRKIPILTFINKMDLPAKDVLGLLEEIEQVLGIHSVPMNWPIGYGKDFKGVIDLKTRKVNLFQRGEKGGAERAEAEVLSLEELKKSDRLSQELLKQLEEELELLEVAGNDFEYQKFLDGKVTPVFFGSALTNFGVETFFDSFVKLAPTPKEYRIDLAGSKGEEIDLNPANSEFRGFVFKIQANMNPKHRDSMAFIRIASGLFNRDINVLHHRSGKIVRLSRSYSMVAQDRDTVDQAFPGDIIGVINPGVFEIGDTVSITGGFNFKPLPQFPPEVIAAVRPIDVMRRKAFEKGINQLTAEGAVQLLRPYDRPDDPPLVAAVGKLQFEVLQFRLKDEYGVQTAIDILPYKHSSYLIGDTKNLRRTSGSYLALDKLDRVVLLVTNEWEKKFILEQSPGLELKEFLG